MPFNVNNNTVVTDDRIVQSVSGAVGSRPATPVTGMMFFNTTDSIMEVYNGTTWVSTTVTTGGGTPNAYAWGSNTSGALGDSSVVTASKSSPVSVVGGFTDWMQVDAGQSHSVGLRANGTLWGWGSNNFGQLGDSSTTSVSSPVAVLGGFSNWVSISVGGYHNVGILTSGDAWAWGRNNEGQLGDTTNIVKSSPIAVSGGFADWIYVAAGQNHSIGIRANGTMWAWGVGTNGQLGEDNILNRNSPVAVVGGIVDWVSASGGRYHSLGIRANGTLYAWGFNGAGQLGDNSVTSRRSPVVVVGGFTDWVNASASTTLGTGSHSMAVRADGTLWAWGGGNYGKLGDNTNVSKSSPVAVVGGFTDWVSTSIARHHSFGVRANGSIWAWGINVTGNLGDGTSGAAFSRSSPVSVVGGFTDWVAVSAGYSFAVGLRAG